MAVFADFSQSRQEDVTLAFTASGQNFSGLTMDVTFRRRFGGAVHFGTSGVSGSVGSTNYWLSSGGFVATVPANTFSGLDALPYAVEAWRTYSGVRAPLAFDYDVIYPGTCRT